MLLQLSSMNKNTTEKNTTTFDSILVCHFEYTIEYRDRNERKKNTPSEIFGGFQDGLYWRLGR